MLRLPRSRFRSFVVALGWLARPQSIGEMHGSWRRTRFLSFAVAAAMRPQMSLATNRATPPIAKRVPHTVSRIRLLADALLVRIVYPPRKLADGALHALNLGGRDGPERVAHVD